MNAMVIAPVRIRVVWLSALLLPLLVMLFAVVLHHRAGCHLLGVVAVAARLLCILLDVFVHALLFRAHALQVLLSGHRFTPSIARPAGAWPQACGWFGAVWSCTCASFGCSLTSSSWP